MKTVCFMRHGQTDWNIGRRLQGQKDIPLNDTGIAQAREAGARFAAAGLRFDTVMASPLSRAVDTAVLVTGAEKANLLLDERLMEIGYGDYEGAVFEELGGAMRAFIRDPDHAPPPPTVETIASLMERTGAFLRDLRDAEGDSILVVTHGVAIRAFLGHLSGDRSRMVWGVPVHNCQLITTTLENGEFTDAVIHEM